MPRLRLALSMIAAACVLLGVAPLAAASQAATPAAVAAEPAARFPARMVEGTCDAPGGGAYELEAAAYGLPVSTGGAGAAATPATVVGAQAANPAAVSATTVDATLDQLVGAAHAVVVRAEMAGGEQTLACGAVGGFRAGNDLVFGLDRVGNSEYAGIAWLRDNGDGTTAVALFLASNLLPAGAGGATPAASAAERAAPLTPAALPPTVEVSGVVIEGGAFSPDRLTLVEDTPTVLHVVNTDDRAYRLRIGDLVPSAALPANRMTVIEFTTPVAMTYVAELLPADDDEPVATIPVEVTAAGA